MSPAPVTPIYLVRHGETDWNRAQRLQGTIDTALNRTGVAQADHVAERLRTLAGAIVVASPLARARHTARAVAFRTHSVVVLDPLLVEIDHGVINALLMCAAVGNVPTEMTQYAQPNGYTYRLLFRRRALVTVDYAALAAFGSTAASSCFAPWRVNS